MTRLCLALSLLLPALAACDDNDAEFWQQPNDLLPMVALDDRVAFVERISQTVFLLDPGDPTLTPRLVPVGKAPVAAVKRNGANQLLVLTKGDRGSPSEPAVPAELHVIDAVAATSDSYPLTGRFDAMAQSDDGRHLVLHHSPSGQSQADSALYNPNEMTLVDFGNPAAPTTKVTPKTIRSLGGVPSAVAFSPSYAFASGPRTLAVVLSQNYVTVQDIDHPDHTEISVPLCPQAASCNLTPAQVVFDPRNLSIYVRVSGAKDIYQITLTDLVKDLQPGQLPPTPPSNDFSASLSMLAVGSTPADMALYPVLVDDGIHGPQPESRLAVASSEARRLVIIDPSTSQAVSVATLVPVDHIVSFVTKVDGKDKQQALLVDRTQGSTSVLFADLEQVATTGGLALSDYPLGAAAKEVHPLFDVLGSVAGVVLVAGNYSGSAAVTVVDLATRSFSTFGASSPLALPTFETRIPSRLWSVDQGTGLCYLNLSERLDPTTGLLDEPRLATGEIWLDQNIVSITPLKTAGSQPVAAGTIPPRYLVVGHNDPGAIGNLTILDADHPDRANARAAYGFLLTNYLERKQP
ncbi:MAG: hypothetical protein JXP73_18785 [Deltaproteobacteria bacterium]|nr:hypothetical protein [Deltaproteobacteria bacterium]